MAEEKKDKKLGPKSTAAITKDEPKEKSKTPEKKSEKSGKKSKKAHKMEVHRKKGGYLVITHRPQEQKEAPMPEESVHPNLSSVQQHMNDNMMQDGDEEAEQAAPAPAPMQGV